MDGKWRWVYEGEDGVSLEPTQILDHRIKKIKIVEFSLLEVES
jgi:hypothetical protein